MKPEGRRLCRDQRPLFVGAAVGLFLALVALIVSG
jgi:hypothetical protein